MSTISGTLYLYPDSQAIKLASREHAATLNRFYLLRTRDAYSLTFHPQFNVSADGETLRELTEYTRRDPGKSEGAAITGTWTLDTMSGDLRVVSGSLVATIKPYAHFGDPDHIEIAFDVEFELSPDGRTLQAIDDHGNGSTGTSNKARDKQQDRNGRVTPNNIWARRKEPQGIAR